MYLFLTLPYSATVARGEAQDWLNKVLNKNWLLMTRWKQEYNIKIFSETVISRDKWSHSKTTVFILYLFLYEEFLKTKINK